MFLKKKSNDSSLFSSGMKIPTTAQDTIPFWEVYENGLFLVGKDRYTLIFAFDNLDYALLRDSEQKETYALYQALLNALPTDITYQEFVMNSAINSEKLRKAMIPESQDNELFEDYCDILEKNIKKSE